MTEFLGKALTFADVLLEPQYSGVLPGEVDLKTRLSKEINLNIPIVSAAMDTVTESRLAIALARLGGIGIIHRNMTSQEQAEQVKIVKRAQSWIIQDPYDLTLGHSILDAKNLMNDNGVSGILVVDDHNTKELIGILTRRDLAVDNLVGYSIKNLMTPREKLVTISSKDVTIEQAKAMMHQHRVEKLPVVDEQFRLIGLITYRDIQGKKQYPEATLDNSERLRVGAAVGVGQSAINRAEVLLNAGVDVVVIDTAHGHCSSVIQTAKQVVTIAHKVGVDVIVGNIATAQSAIDLIEQVKPDALKVGIGPGATCTTRGKTGCGVPQLTAIMEVVKGVKGTIPIIADGGICEPGDITKAIAAGADSIMIGGLFAGADESPGELTLCRGRFHKNFRGMGSRAGMRAGSADRYSQEGIPEKKVITQGVEGMVPVSGPLEGSIIELIGGLRAGMGLLGANSVTELRGHGRFWVISVAGAIESKPHDIIVTEESSSYSPEEVR